VWKIDYPIVFLKILLGSWRVYDCTKIREEQFISKVLAFDHTLSPSRFQTSALKQGAKENEHFCIF